MESLRYADRVDKCCHMMEAGGFDVLILIKPANMFYLTGDGRLCAYTMITRDRRVAIGVPSTDVTDARDRARADEVVGFEDEVGMIHSIAHYFARFCIDEGTMGLEYSFLTAPRMGMLTHPHAKPAGVQVKDASYILSELRVVKDHDEVRRLQAAARAADAAMAAAIGAVRPGTTESEIAGVAELAMRRAGADDFARTYVSSGPRTNIAHGLPTQRRLEPGDLVMIDIHPMVEGYTGDLCRMASVGPPRGEQMEAHNLFLRAQRAAVAKVRTGMGIVELEEEIHGALRAAGHGDHIFGPPIHGIGIDMEESPLPPGHAFFHGEQAPPPLQTDVAIAVGNCGLYTGRWGVRVEDTVVVRPEGPLELTNYPRELAIAT